MTNFEYWKDRILEIVISGDILALKNGNPIECYHVSCENCNFYSDKTNSCNKKRFEWLYSEHEEKPKLTKRERKLCEALETGWIAADKNGRVFWMVHLPVDGDYRNLVNMRNCICVSDVGLFIDFKSEHPWLVQDLLLLEVEE